MIMEVQIFFEILRVASFDSDVCRLKYRYEHRAPCRAPY